MAKQKKSHKSTIDQIEVFGARVHNLRDIDVSIPRNKLVVITGISGSGKSSLAFDTLYAEGQRRYLESFAAYARQFMGGMERPDVDKITGLSPVISIEQKSTSRNPRSTVGTVTEIYDFFRLMFARIGEAYSYATGKKMVRYTEEQIIAHIIEHFSGSRVHILAPLVRGRKGHYRELFDQVRKQGYLKIRVDGEMLDLSPKMQVDRYKVHDIELVVDRLKVSESTKDRIRQSCSTALKMGKGLMMVQVEGEEKPRVFSKLLMCPETGLSYEEPSPNTFSFNSPYGACSKCNGLGYLPEVNMSAVIPDDSVSINRGGIAPLGEARANYLFKELKSMASKQKFSLARPIKELPEEVLDQILHGRKGQREDALTDLSDPGKWYNLKSGGVVELIRRCLRYSSSDAIRRWAETFVENEECPECKSARLKKEALYFKVDEKNIADIAGLNLETLQDWLADLESRLNDKQRAISKELLKEIRARVGFLLDVGLNYLTMNRPARSLSGGEAQRIRLATQIGSKLTGVTYILDEPSIGLHQRDNDRLIASLRKLADSGNSVLVVEHDKEIMLRSDHIIDLGPGAGEHGGRLVASSKPDVFIQAKTLTASYLRNEKVIEMPAQRRKGNGLKLVLKKATGHNLKAVNLKLPLGKLICVTGVSGSGKSSLINETLHPILHQHFYKTRKKALPYQSISGLDALDKSIVINQSPIGRTPRSNPATYIKVFDEIRRLFAEMPEAKIRGYKPGRFSFNVKGGRCEECGGAGVKVVEMNFLPNVHVECEKCMGKRYNRETLEVRFKGKSISDVLNMTVEDAVVFFEAQPKIYRKVKTLQDVGLSYIRLGQPSTTVSGGEAQRVKLAAELSKRDTGKTFYILDEPTTGLHFEDIRVLLDVLHKLVDKGNTVLIIEHNLDVVKVADHVIDLGPEGGDAGGTILFEGTPEKLTQCKSSHTGRFLKKELDDIASFHAMA